MSKGKAGYNRANKTDQNSKPASKRRAILTPPKKLSSESDWIEYLSGVSIVRLLDFIRQKPDRVDTTLALVIKKIANDLLREVEEYPDGHNEWLEYFSRMTSAETANFMAEHETTLDNEASTAGLRWLEIADNPSLIDKITVSRIESQRATKEDDLLEAVKAGDKLATYQIMAKNMASKISEGVGARDMSQMIKQLDLVMDNIAELERKQDTTANTPIRKLLIKSRSRAIRASSVQASKKVSDTDEYLDSLDDID